MLPTFNADAMELSLGLHKVLKVIRWSPFLSDFNYRIEHVPSDLNIGPNMMTRLMRRYRKESNVSHFTTSVPCNGFIGPPESPQFEYSNTTEIGAVKSRNIYSDLRTIYVNASPVLTSAMQLTRFVASYLLFLLLKSRNKVPRPLSTTFHATKPHEVINFDYIFMGEGEQNQKYLLVFKAELFGYFWLDPHTASET